MRSRRDRELSILISSRDSGLAESLHFGVKASPHFVRTGQQNRLALADRRGRLTRVRTSSGQ
jgi:hypothetical protein